MRHSVCVVGNAGTGKSKVPNTACFLSCIVKKLPQFFEENILHVAFAFRLQRNNTLFRPSSQPHNVQWQGLNVTRKFYILCVVCKSQRKINHGTK